MTSRAARTRRPSGPHSPRIDGRAIERARFAGRPRSAGRVRRREAFSLLELLAVVTILGTLAVVIIPRIGSSTNRAKTESCRQYKAEINAAAERYFFNEGKLPDSLDALASDEDYFTAPIPVCPVTKQAYSIDARTGRVAGHDH
ncbi:MAG: type II secretion system protein [Planctomycetes bacterium]|nr:type II secretion system protein [Planctomycetota bacterium]